MGTRGNIFEQTGCLIYYLIPLIVNAESEGWGVAISIIAILLFVLISVERKLDVSSDRARLKRKREYQDELMDQLLSSLENEGLYGDLQSNKDRLIRKAMELSMFESETSDDCIDFSISVIKFEDYLGALIDNRYNKRSREVYIDKNNER